MNEVYAAIYTRLAAVLTEEVYDHVPQDLGDSGYPFVKLNPLQLVNFDTDTENAFQATIQVVGYSRYRGTKEINTLCDSIYNALHHYEIPNTTSYAVGDIAEESRQIINAPDGLTRNSVQQYRVYFEPLPA